VGDSLRVLIVDDDAAVTNYLMVFLVQTERYEPVVENDSSSVPALLERESFDLMLLDMDMPGMSGVEILRRVNERGGNIPVIILTGVSDVELAVKAMKLGAFDYLTKPVDDDLLLSTMDRAIEHGALSRTLSGLSGELSRDGLANKAAFEDFVSLDPAMVRLFHHAEKLAGGDFSIFINGEHGTGKEALARAIHSTSRRSAGPFVAFDAAAVPTESVAGELFGTVCDFRGEHDDRPGFLESAAGGTLFLNSIELLPMPVQVRLRRVIQNGEFYREFSAGIRRIDVRLIVSTTVDLGSDEYRDRFSRDLLYHLMINSISIPPLRAHPGDIAVLAENFARREAEKLGRRVVVPSAGLTAMLSSYSFPGNVEELEAIIALCVVSADGQESLTPECLPDYVRERIDAGLARQAAMPDPLADVIRRHAMKALDYWGGDMQAAARGLGITVEELERLSG
jgi:DNA-binding NtrC family response regulator